MRYALPLAALAALGFAASPAGASLVLREVPEKATLNNPLFEALGTAKGAVGDMVYLRADEYFHKGMERNLLETHQLAGENPSDPNFHVKIQTDDWAMRVNRRIKVVDHQHLGQKDAKEILPLLYASTVLNPENLDAVLTAAYWLEKSTGSVEQSLEVLTRTAEAHPGEWKIAFAVGQLLADKKKDPAAAIPHFERAVAHLTPHNALPFDWIRVRVALGDALAATGDSVRAVAVYRETLLLAEQREKSQLPNILRQKIKKLEQIGL